MKIDILKGGDGLYELVATVGMAMGRLHALPVRPRAPSCRANRTNRREHRPLSENGGGTTVSSEQHRKLLLLLPGFSFFLQLNQLLLEFLSKEDTELRMERKKAEASCRKGIKMGCEQIAYRVGTILLSKDINKNTTQARRRVSPFLSSCSLLPCIQ